MVAIGRTEDGWPGKFDTKIPVDAIPLQLFPLLVDEHRPHPRQRQRSMRRFFGRDTRQIRDKNAAGLGLPPRIDDRAAAFPDILVIPMPGLLVDRLAYRAQHPQGAKVLSFYEVKTETHQAADRRRRRV